MNTKVDKLKEIFKKIDPSVELGVDDQGDNAYAVVGPFPSFMIMVPLIGPLRALVHVNADAPNMTYIFSEFAKELDIVHDGAFAIDAEQGRLLFNEDAYAKKEDNILHLANEILLNRKNKVTEQKLILGAND